MKSRAVTGTADKCSKREYEHLQTENNTTFRSNEKGIFIYCRWINDEDENEKLADQDKDGAEVRNRPTIMTENSSIVV